MYYKLVLQNPVEGIDRKVWTFRAPATLGREPGADVCIDHHSISRQHCHFTLNGDEALVVKDLGSTNGIYVDDNRIKQSVLMPGQILQVGALGLEIKFASEDELLKTSGVRATGSVDKTRAMPIFDIDPPAGNKPWWKKLF